MKGFKGFAPGLVCRGKQYAENTVFEEDNAVICCSGMHFCEMPFEVLKYYGFLNNKAERNDFAEVEALADTKSENNEKFCTTKLKVGAKIGIPGLVKAQIEWTRQNAEKGTAGGNCSNLAGGDKSNLAGGNCSNLAGGDKSNLAGGDCSNLAGGDKSNLAGGDCSNLAGGYSSNLAGGYRSNLAGGDGSNLAGGYRSNLAGGYRSNLAGGDSSNLAGGDRSNLAGGYRSNLAGGDSSNLAGGDSSNLAGGDSSNLAGGGSSVLVGRNGCKARGGKNSVIVLTEWEWIDDENYVPVAVKAEIVDGERIKENTFYKLENGEFVEAE